MLGRRVHVELGQSQQFFPGVPEVAERLFVGFQEAAVRGHKNDGVEGAFENRAEFPFRLLQLPA